MPKVSVIIPCYNLGKYLNESVASVLAQTSQDFEIIIIDDGSTDFETCELLKNAGWPKTKIIRTGNKGASAARNIGFRNSAGDYILPLDADDKLARTALELMTKALDSRPEIDFVYGQTQNFGLSADLVSAKKLTAPEILTSALASSCGIMCRRKIWQETGGHPENLRALEDWDFQITLFERGYKYSIIDQPLYFYRIRKRSNSRQTEAEFLKLMAAMIDNHRELYNKYSKDVILDLYKKQFEIYQTKSWQVTKPLRAILYFLKNLSSWYKK